MSVNMITVSNARTLRRIASKIACQASCRKQGMYLRKETPVANMNVASISTTIWSLQPGRQELQLLDSKINHSLKQRIYACKQTSLHTMMNSRTSTTLHEGGIGV